MDIPPFLTLSDRFDHEDVQGSVKVLLDHFRPELRDRLKNEELIIKEFTGGITNKLLAAYFASDKMNKTLIRVYGAETDKMIDRAGEIRTLLILNVNDCCGRLYGVFNNGICYEFVPGIPLTIHDVREKHMSRLIIREFVKLHCAYREKSHLPSMDLFGKMSSLLQLAPSRYADPEKQRKFQEYFPNPNVFAESIETLKRHLINPNITSPIVFCHNDVLCANILYDKEKDCVNFIDFEYAGLNYQAYDLANHFNEFAGVLDCDYNLLPKEDFQLEWLRYYLQCWNEAHGVSDVEVTDLQVRTLFVTVNKFTLASHLFWTLCCLIQAEHSEVDFDFLTYSKIRFDEYNRRKDEFPSLH